MAPKRKRGMNEGEEVVMYVTKPDREEFAYTAAQLNMTRACTAPSTCTDIQRSAYLIGFLTNIFPREREAFGNALVKMGVKPVWKDMPFDDEEKELEPKLQKESVIAREIALVMGLAVTFLYKNVTDRNITSFVRTTVGALAAKACVMPEHFKNPTFFLNLGYVTAYRRLMGRNHDIRRIVLEAVIANKSQKDIVGYTCVYLFNYLEWTDMSAMRLIQETLEITDSPVLRCRQVADEVKNFRVALRAVNKCRYPQFFRILADGVDQTLAEKAKFPILFAVSEKIRSGGIAENAHYVRSTANSPEDLVAYLAHKHIMNAFPYLALANKVVKAAEKLQKYF